MTLKEFRESYHNATGKASDLARSTNYSLIAIVWVLCGQDLAKVSSYRCVLIWLLLSLAIDYVQYLIMALFASGSSMPPAPPDGANGAPGMPPDNEWLS